MPTVRVTLVALSFFRRRSIRAMPGTVRIARQSEPMAVASSARSSATLRPSCGAHHSAAAQARRVPWLRYVEGSYAAEENESEWEVRAVAEIPVADWLGDRVRRSRAELAAAETRVRGLYETVRLEVAGVLEDYRSASAERDRLVADCEQFSAAMSARIAALAQEPTVGREDVLQAREELVAYRRACLKAEREWLRLAQYLETVSGGSLAEAPPGQGPGATPAPRQEEHISP